MNLITAKTDYLNFTMEQLMLTFLTLLISKFFLLSKKKSDFRKEICCIYGFLESGRYCILHKCNLQLSGNLFGLMGTLIHFKYLFYSSNENLIKKEVEFSKIEIRLNMLFKWSGINSIEAERIDKDNITLNHKRPSEAEKMFSNDDYKINLKKKNF